MNKRKDEMAQVYYVEIVPNGTVESKYKHYIYTEAQKLDGGLYANVRDMYGEEKAQGGIALNVDIAVFTFNRNPKITKSCKIEYRGGVYDIDTIDNLDYRTVDIKVKARKTVDNTKYAGSRYDD